MDRIIGREVGAATMRPAIKRLLWVDLTAGDGLVEDGKEWVRNCSVGLLLFHALSSVKPVYISISEILPATFVQLTRALDSEAPLLGYTKTRYGWRARSRSGAPIKVKLTNASGADTDIKGTNDTTAVLVCHDPNTITQRALRPTFVAEVRELSPWFQMIYTMGCNVGGLHRLSFPDRMAWFTFVDEVVDQVEPWHDLIIAAIDGDAQRWGYLVCYAKKWEERVRQDFDRAFESNGMTLKYAVLSEDPELFQEIQIYLFLTVEERRRLVEYASAVRKATG